MPQDVKQDDHFEQLKRLYNNPEIKKQFPTMYSFYLNEEEKRLKMDEYEKETDDTEDTKYKIGGISNQKTDFNSAIDDAPTSMNTSQAVSDNDINQNLVRRFMSLNF